MRILLKIIIPVLAGLIFITGILYLAESRLFLIGKAVFPAYTTISRASDLIRKNKPGIKDTIVYCDYYTWHDEQHWKRGYSDIPLLGFYNSTDPAVMDQHIDWTDFYGIDVLKIEYIPQFDDTIKDGILNHDLKDTRLCLMYDPLLRFENIGYKEPPYDFNNNEIAQIFIDDCEHMADTYFESENYFKISGRPVLWIYIARDFTGAYEEAIDTVRNNLKKKGYDIYLVGDVVFWNYRFSTISAFDAISCYSAYAGRPDNTGRFAERLKFLYMAWKTAAMLANKDFIPAGIPAYNDTCLSSERYCITPLSGSTEDFKYQLEIIREFLDPVNIDPTINQVTIATFNEHQEGSSVEPAEQWGFERIEKIPVVFGYN